MNNHNNSMKCQYNRKNYFINYTFSSRTLFPLCTSRICGAERLK